MKKIFLILCLLILVLTLLACDSATATKDEIAKYYLNSDGNLVLEYKSGETVVLGHLDNTSDISINSVVINDDGYYVINGVTTDIQAIQTFTVQFNTGTSQTVASQIIKDGYRVTKPSISRTGYTLVGWFYNDEEWLFNQSDVKNDMTLTARWTPNQYNISFVNEKGTNPANQVVTFDQNTTLPTVDEVTGYRFDGWYSNNTKVPNGSWNIAEDVTLTAKWVKKTYTVTLDAKAGTVSQTSKTVSYGDSFSLPIPTNSYGTFIGWKYGNSLITDENGNGLSIWDIDEDITAWVDWTIKIYTVDDLKSMNTYLNGEFALMNNLDLNNEEWTPIGSEDHPFTGKFDGKLFTISNLKITQTSGATGFFGYLSGNVQNLVIGSGSINITSINCDSYVGIVCGYAKNATLQKVFVGGTVTTGSHSSDYTVYTGGLCGKSENSSFSSIMTEIDVSGYDYAAGISASIINTSITKCINAGSVTSTQGCAGGIIAQVEPVAVNRDIQLTKVRNDANVTALLYCAGIISSQYPNHTTSVTVELTECCNNGNITSTDTSSSNFGVAAAGLIGGNFYRVTIIDCYNTGNISGKICGGLIGYISESTIRRCYSTGTITASSASGGFGGNGNTTIGDSVVFGTIQLTSSSLVNNVNCSFGSAQTGLTLNLQNFYYNCTCDNYSGTETTNTYESAFYQDTLYWSTDVWSFSTTAYPRLKWEKNNIVI